MEDQSIMLNLPELLPSIIAISEHAGQAIMAIYNQPERWELQQKVDNSPLTAADLAAHHLIEQALQQLTPSISVLSEESDDVSQRHTWSRLWLVDPLDGTKEFVARTNDFTVNIALIVDNKPVLGVLHAPVYGVTYYAAEGLGAWMIDQDKQLRRLVTAELPIIPRILLSRHHQGHEEAHTLTNIAMKFGDYTVLHVGSAFKMCRIAEGAADFYPRFGATMEWDTAAAQILLTEDTQTEYVFTPLAKPSSYGLDDMELLFSANLGQTPQPLAKIASGGELSRFSLVKSKLKAI